MKKLLLILIMASFTSVNAQYAWEQQATGYPVASSYTGDISIVSADIVWSLVQRTSAANHQQISLTTDGGATWTSKAVNLNNAVGLGIGNISAVSATTAYISVFPVSAALATQGIYRTINGGNTWAKVSSAAFGSNSFTNLVHFFDSTSGIAMGDPVNGKFEIYKATNGIWSAVPAANLPTPLSTPATVAGDPDIPEYGYTGKYYAKGNTIWIGTGNGRLLRSTDKGLNWTAITTPVLDFGGGINPANTAEFAFRDDNNGVILRSNYSLSADVPPVATYVDFTLFKTADGGASWTDITDVSQVVYHSGVSYAGNVLYSNGANTNNFGTSFSTDDGVTWTELDALSHTCLKFQSESVGFSGGFATSTTAGGIYKLVPATVNTNTFTADNFTVSPNPVTDVLKISNSKGINFTNVYITDINGRTVKSFNANNLTASQVNVAELTAGIYFLNITSDAGKAVKKFIKN